jgi:hypothetical protein
VRLPIGRALTTDNSKGAAFGSGSGKGDKVMNLEFEVQITDPIGIRLYKELKHAILNATLPSKQGELICHGQVVANWAEMNVCTTHD